MSHCGSRVFQPMARRICCNCPFIPILIFCPFWIRLRREGIRRVSDAVGAGIRRVPCCGSGKGCEGAKWRGLCEACGCGCPCVSGVRFEPVWLLIEDRSCRDKTLRLRLMSEILAELRGPDDFIGILIMGSPPVRLIYVILSLYNTDTENGMVT